MDCMVLQGGRRLTGEVSISGAKNAALPILASILLGKGTCTLINVPAVRDVLTMSKVLTHLGASVEARGDRYTITLTGVASCQAPYELVKTMRASVLVLGPLLARWGEAIVALPGGCAIGARPINLHLAALEKMGAEIRIEHGNVHACVRGRLKGARINFDIPTVTGTENVMMAASLAEGTTVLENAATEPEVSDLASFLIKRGARISGAGTDVITIDGVPELRGADHEIVPDRVETGTYLIAGAITGGEVRVVRCRPDHCDALLAKLQEAGVALKVEKEAIQVRAGGPLRAVDVKTLPYPGFPTDMQAPLLALVRAPRGGVVKRSGYEGHPPHRSLQGQAAGARDRPLQMRGLGAQGYFARKPPTDLRASGQRDYAHDRQAQRRPHLRGIRSRGCGGRRRGYLDGTGDGRLRAARSGVRILPPGRGRAAT